MFPDLEVLSPRRGLVSCGADTDGDIWFDLHDGIWISGELGSDMADWVDLIIRSAVRNGWEIHILSLSGTLSPVDCVGAATFVVADQLSEAVGFFDQLRFSRHPGVAVIDDLDHQVDSDTIDVSGLAQVRLSSHRPPATWQGHRLDVESDTGAAVLTKTNGAVLSIDLDN